MIKVVLAQPRGFCAGVVRAIDIVDQALIKFGAPVYVRHEIVHNRHVVDNLKGKGAVFVEELNEVPEGAVTVFSAHGVARSVVNEAKERSLPVLDATCPLVSKVHHQGKHYVAKGRTLILIGHAGHPEVEGTMGQIDGPVHLVSHEADVAALDLALDVIIALKARFSDVAGPDIADICYATQNRQTAVRDICKVVDALLVVGANYSSNSKRLCEIGQEMGIPSYLVADGSEIDPLWMDGVKTVGLTAGASAPEELVLTVIDALRVIDEVVVMQMNGIEEHIEFRLPAALRRAEPKPVTGAATSVAPRFTLSRRTADPVR
jgi:4-hydroxy-3-methylbut-2-enyl diphosphate reductase